MDHCIFVPLNTCRDISKKILKNISTRWYCSYLSCSLPELECVCANPKWYMYVSTTAVLEVSLHPYRTGTTLCVPSPPFSHTTRHTLLLDSGEPVQKYVMAACGGGLGGGVPFELWRRYYYPNIRDQLVARVNSFN